MTNIQDFFLSFNLVDHAAIIALSAVIVIQEIVFLILLKRKNKKIKAEQDTVFNRNTQIDWLNKKSEEIDAARQRLARDYESERTASTTLSMSLRVVQEKYESAQSEISNLNKSLEDMSKELASFKNKKTPKKKKK